MFIFVAGMTRSGKSEYAERRALELSEGSQKIYVATSAVHDSEMQERVLLHKARRKNMGFTTIEQTHDLGKIIIPEGSCVLIESLTAWLANEMFTCTGINFHAGKKIYEDFMILMTKAKNIILVSDDIFSDGVIYDSLTEEYVKILGKLHVKLAAIADEVIECVSGIPVRYSIITRT